MPDTELESIPEKNLEDIKKIVSLTYRNLEKISRIIDNIEKEKRKEMYKNMPGVSGYFDGFYLIGDDGSKYEVPANYAAKSRIVFGDTLKMLDEDGKKIFKQIDKVPRKKLEGVLSKKEGKWYFLSDDGTYRISDIAAEFHKAELNDKAFAYIPENNLKAEYAALDCLEKEKTGEVDSSDKSASKPKNEPKTTIVKSVAQVTKNVQKKPIPVESKTPEVKKRPLPKPAPKEMPKSKPVAKTQPKKDEKTLTEQPKPEKEFIANIMEDDDLR